MTIPEYISVNNGDGSYSAIRIHGISATVFRGNTAIKGVLFPKYVSAIPAEAFAGCTSLEVVSGYGIQEIGAGAFRGCSSLGKFSMDKYITSLPHSERTPLKMSRKSPSMQPTPQSP